MNIQRCLVCLIAFATLLTAQVANAQRWATSNGDPPTNPVSGTEVDPTFCYDPGDGLLYLYNAGPNGVDDGSDGGDDFYFGPSFLLTTNSTSVEAVLPLTGDGIAWSAPVIFNGNLQWSGNAIGSPGYLPISEEPIALLRLDVGLTADDFRDSDTGNVMIETSSIFSLGDAFETGAFKIVPEPAGLSLMLIAGLGLFVRMRR